ncbi:MAG: UDP-3-O-[3-hydroxymyristoyl] glucosamine N-acyltransferase [Alphaproteobacteria bacterium]|jgi:UDP-3-O-[3-hydroxymyristoyl] glucosamine N-acyltransferase
MPDARFFSRSGPFTLEELAEITGSTIANATNPKQEILDVSPLDLAQPGDISFLDNRKYVTQLASCKASACILSETDAKIAPNNLTLLITDTPYKAYAIVATAFYPDITARADIHPSAVIHETATIGTGCQISPGVVIERGAFIGENCILEPNAVIGAAVQLGANTRVGANASLSHCQIGARVHLYPGVRIGQRGFGFAMDVTGHKKVPQLGIVIVGDDVEVGANTTIDRGAGPDTIIGDGVMIDNLVQIGHNVRIGSGSVIVAQTGISGSSTLESFVALGGQSGVAGHLTIGAGAQIGAQSGVMRDVKPGERLVGSPATPTRQFFRQLATIERMTKNKGVKP